MSQALLLIDVQQDFMPGGPLGVPGANEIIPIINHLQTLAPMVIASLDWHPLNHGSFANNHPNKNPGDYIELAGLKQILWPQHCVQHTHGASPAQGLDTNLWQTRIYKGTDPLVDSYSAFFDNAKRNSTALHAFLQAHRIDHLFLAGVATDYCVKYTALDARALGYRVSLHVEACRAVNLNAHDNELALAEMAKGGVSLI